MKRKTKKTIGIAIIIIILIIIAFVSTLYYITSTVNNYSYSEKNWMSENQSKIFDIYIDNTLPIFALNGKGVFYDYVNALKENTGLDINVTSTASPALKLSNKTTIDESDIVFYKDHYIVVGEGEALSKLSDLSYKKIGILKSDEESIKYYLTDYTGINFEVYENFSSLRTSYESDIVNYIVIPMYKYINEVVSSDMQILFHLDGLYSYYTLSLDPSNKTLDSILTKFYSRWEQTAKSKTNKYFLDMYYQAKKYTELEKESITSEDFIVGYIPNLPFEGMIRRDFTGLTDTYLSKFADMTSVTYDYISYNDTKQLNESLLNTKIDLALNYYSLSSENYDSSRTLGSTDYVVLAHVDNNLVVNSLYSLVNSTVTMLSNMNLKYNMASKNLFEIKDYATIKSMIKNVDKDSIIIIEKEVYDYYKDNGLNNYSIRYLDNIKLNNSFLLNKDNVAFNKLFDFYLSTLSSNEVKNESVEGVFSTLKENRVISFIIDNIIYITVSILVVALIIYGVAKNALKQKKNKKEDRLFYFDMMTNLKNRNFLNDSISFWSSSKVYPQTMIVLDIDRLKVLNDRHGHEAGDNQIKAVASVLIKQQRDNSEIMRTDGDEFMIYLVGYDEKKISIFIHKLLKEINHALPDKDHGVSIGYSMIENELKTIDDAISESIVMIKKNREGRNER